MDLTDMREKVLELARENERIAIAACLPMIYEEARAAKPKMIVELGVSREALANKVLALVAEENEATFVSCDLHDFSEVCRYPRWYFYQVEARMLAVRFRQTCEDLKIPPRVNLLFVDCDEKYETTRGILMLWKSFLQAGSTVMLRCTNLKKELVYADGRRTNLGWDNERGVMRAVEEELGIWFDETREYSGKINGYEVKHIPWGAGLTTLRILK
jgi:hypothetical protein